MRNTFAIHRDAAKLWLFTINADVAYPIVLTEMGVEGRPTQDDLEIAHNIIKLDAQMAIRQADPPMEADKTPVIIIEGGLPDDEHDAAYKERWGVKHAPPGKQAALRASNEDAWSRQCAADAKAWYQRTRGYLPS